MTLAHITEFFVPGTPIAQGSKRLVRTKSGKTIMLDAAPRLKPWRDRCASFALDAMNGVGILHGAVHVHAVFTFARPKTHLKKDGSLRKGKPHYHVSKPDIDKLERALLDALTGVVWIDDSQVNNVIKRKEYGPEPGVRVQIHAVAP